jgi:hypothetical protein
VAGAILHPSEGVFKPFQFRTYAGSIPRPGRRRLVERNIKRLAHLLAFGSQRKAEMLRVAYPELNTEILRFAQDDTERAQDDNEGARTKAGGLGMTPDGLGIMLTLQEMLRGRRDCWPVGWRWERSLKGGRGFGQPPGGLAGRRRAALRQLVFQLGDGAVEPIE